MKLMIYERGEVFRGERIFFLDVEIRLNYLADVENGKINETKLNDLKYIYSVGIYIEINKQIRK